MIVCHLRRIAIFLVPRTGSYSLYSLFKQHNICTHIRHKHFTWDWACNLAKIPDFDQYRAVAFYRDPVDRLTSEISYCRRQWPDRLIAAVHGHQLYARLRYPEITNVVNTITATEILETWSRKYPASDLFRLQSHWLDHPTDFNYFNFHNYDQEVRRLTSMFDIEVDSVPQLNQYHDPNYAITGAELDYVRNYYQADYDFFDRKGIKF